VSFYRGPPSIGERSDAVLRTAMPGSDKRKSLRLTFWDDRHRLGTLDQGPTRGAGIVRGTSRRPRDGRRPLDRGEWTNSRPRRGRSDAAPRGSGAKIAGMTVSSGRPPRMQTYTVDIAGEPVMLPIVPINQKLAISLLMVIDMGVKFGERIGKAMADHLRPLKPDIIV